MRNFSSQRSGISQNKHPVKKILDRSLFKIILHLNFLHPMFQIHVSKQVKTLPLLQLGRKCPDRHTESGGDTPFHLFWRRAKLDDLLTDPRAHFLYNSPFPSLVIIYWWGPERSRILWFVNKDFFRRKECQSREKFVSGSNNVDWWI